MSNEEKKQALDENLKILDENLKILDNYLEIMKNNSKRYHMLLNKMVISREFQNLLNYLTINIKLPPNTFNSYKLCMDDRQYRHGEYFHSRVYKYIETKYELLTYIETNCYDEVQFVIRKFKYSTFCQTILYLPQKYLRKFWKCPSNTFTPDIIMRLLLEIIESRSKHFTGDVFWANKHPSYVLNSISQGQSSMLLTFKPIFETDDISMLRVIDYIHQCKTELAENFKSYTDKLINAYMYLVHNAISKSNIFVVDMNTITYLTSKDNNVIKDMTVKYTDYKNGPLLDTAFTKLDLETITLQSKG